MVAKRAPGYPSDHTIARRIIDTISANGAPMTADQLSVKMLRKVPQLSKPITLLVVGGWLIPTNDDPVAYALSDRALELISKPQPVWETTEHREWMKIYRDRWIDRIRNNRG